MKALKKLLYPSLVIFTLAASIAIAGCGGSMASSSSATANGGNPTPTPGASPSPTPTGGAPSNAQVISDIQKLTGWQTCVLSCAGAPAAVFSMTQGIVSPSLSGSSDRFSRSEEHTSELQSR